MIAIIKLSIKMRIYPSTSTFYILLLLEFRSTIYQVMFSYNLFSKMYSQNIYISNRFDLVNSKVMNLEKKNCEHTQEKIPRINEAAFKYMLLKVLVLQDKF